MGASKDHMIRFLEMVNEMHDTAIAIGLPEDLQMALAGAFNILEDHIERINNAASMPVRIAATKEEVIQMVANTPAAYQQPANDWIRVVGL